MKTILVLLAAGGLSLALPFPPAHAATIAVSTPGDAGGPSDCTLRQAIAAMNSQSTSGGGCVAAGAFGSDDRIEFAPGIGTVTLADAATSILTVTAIDLTIASGHGTIIERPAGATHAFGLLQLGTMPEPSPPPRHLRLQGLTLRGGSTVDPGPNAGGLTAFLHGRLTLSDCVVEDNHSIYAGGGITSLGATVELERSTLRGNVSSAYGAGALLASYAPLTRLVDSHVHGNRCTGTDFCLAGGIAIYGNGALDILGSTLSDNHNLGGDGGALWVEYGDLALRNSTVSGNSASGHGGGIHVTYNYFATVLRNSTLTGNDAALGGGGFALYAVAMGMTGDPPPPRPRLDSTLVWGNRAGGDAGADGADLLNQNPGFVTGHMIVEGSHNLVGQPGGVAANGVEFVVSPLTADPALGALIDNGGPTPSHAIGAGSPALDAGSNLDALDFDQRGPGHPRVSGEAADIGAYEHLQVADGQCGAAHGVPATAAPQENLCAIGTPGVVSGSGPWHWTCHGDPGGGDASCSAPLLAGVQLLAGNSGGFPASTAVYGEGVSLRLEIEGAPDGGNATFCDGGEASASPAGCGGGTLLCADVPVVAGIAACAVAPALEPGAHALQAAYGGNGDVAAGTASLALEVNAAATATQILSIAPAESQYGAAGDPDPVWVEAGVSVPPPGAGVADGQVRIEDGVGGPSCSFALATDYGCELVPAKAAGTHTLIATYEPGVTGRFLASSGEAGLLVRRRTVTSVADPLSDATVGAAAIIPVHVGHGAAPAVSGAVKVCANGAPTLVPADCGGGVELCASVTLAFGNVQCASSALPPGEHAIVAIFLGDATNAPSISGPVALRVNRHFPWLELESDPNPSLENGTVRLTATLHASSGHTPTGIVDFTLDGSMLCEAAPLAEVGGDIVAICDTTALPPGESWVQARYGGDDNHLPAFASLDWPHVVLPQATLTLADASVVEGDAAGVATLAFTLDVPVTGGFSVSWSTQDLTARAGEDYVARSGTLSHDGDPSSEYAISIPIVDDDELEPTEHFRIAFGAVQCANSPCPVVLAGAQVEILDDDAPAPGLAVSVDNGTHASDPGDMVLYRIRVTNAADLPALAAPLDDQRPPELLDALWTCVVNRGGSCAPETGVGDVSTLLNLPPGATATLELSAEVGQFGPHLVYRVEVTPPPGYDDPDPDDNVAIDIDVVRTVFADGFE